MAFLLWTDFAGAQGYVNPPQWSKGYVSAAAGTTVATKLINSRNPPVDLNAVATGAITTWNITLPNPTYDGQIITISCPGGNVGTINLSTSDGSTIGTIVGTSCTQGTTYASFQYSQIANSWLVINTFLSTPLALHVATNAVLAASTIAQFPFGVWRDDYASGNGAAPLFFKTQTGTCAANSMVNDGGSCVNEASGNSFKAVFSNGVAEVREFGAKCDGSTNDTTAVQAWATFGGVLAGASNKTCVTDQIALASGSTIYGQGMTLKRIASSANSYVLNGDGTTGVTIRDLIVDGNKANNTLAQGGISFQSSASQITLINVTTQNVKANAGGGWGLAIVNSVDGANGTTSVIQNYRAINNDFAGAFFNGVVKNLQIRGFSSYGSWGMQFNGAVGATDQIDGVLVSGFNIDCAAKSGANGIAVAGLIQSNGSLGPVYNYAYMPTWNIQIEHGSVKNCPQYGVAVQANNAVVDDVHILASGTVAGYAGVLFNADNSTLENSTVDFVGTQGFGVDAGGCVDCVISGNVIGPLRQGSQGTGIGLNVGGALNTIASHNSISGNGTLIAAYRYEADGNNIAFPWASDNLILTGNVLVCATTSCIGILAVDGMELKLDGNDVEGTSLQNSYSLITHSIKWGARNATGGVYGLTVVASANQLVIPDDTETVYLTGTTTINQIITYSQQAVGQFGISFVNITNNGSSPYSSAPTVSFTGGTCSVAPTATAYLSGSGFVWGVRMTGYGTCTVAPTGVSFSGGGGAGAAGTVQAGLPYELNGRKLGVVTQGALTLAQNVANPGTLFNRSGSSIATAAGNAYFYLNVFGSWTQNQ